MKRTIWKGLALLAVAAMFASPVARAACTLDSQPVKFGLDGFIDNCPDANPIQAHIYLLSAPNATNSNGNGFVCRADTDVLAQSPPQECIFSPGSGSYGDGKITILEEFGTGTATLGCPNPSGSVPGANPVAVQVTCNNGAGLIIVTGFSESDQAYLLEYASPNGTSFSANFNNGPQITSVGAGPSPSVNNVCVNVQAPHAFSDCDLGPSTTCPNPATRPALARGALVTRTGPCGGSPDLRTKSCAQSGASCLTDTECGGAIGSCGTAWIPLPIQPNAAGDACNNIQQPTVAGQCAFLGVTNLWGTLSTDSVGSWIQINTQGAATDKVKIDRAGFDGGKLVVAFSTSNETSIVGFNVYSGSLKLNGNRIVAKGTGSNPYSFEIGRGALKGGKTVEVESVKSDGSVERTGPVSLK